MVVAETMVVGTPIVSFDCPSGPFELLEGGRCGYLVPDQNVPQFAEALYRALSIVAEARSKATLARKKIQEFDVSKIVKRYTDLLEKEIAEKWPHSLRQSGRVS
jgi:glycosyltransferase involved in cell wall biosynthesis